MRELDEMGSAWTKWSGVMRTVVLLMQKDDSYAALTEIDRFLLDDIPPELLSDALGMRADLKEQMGDFEGAEADLRSAYSIVASSYLRYVHELSFASLSRKRQR